MPTENSVINRKSAAWIGLRRVITSNAETTATVARELVGLPRGPQDQPSDGAGPAGVGAHPERVDLSAPVSLRLAGHQGPLAGIGVQVRRPEEHRPATGRP